MLNDHQRQDTTQLKPVTYLDRNAAISAIRASQDQRETLANMLLGMGELILNAQTFALRGNQLSGLVALVNEQIDTVSSNQRQLQIGGPSIASKVFRKGTPFHGKIPKGDTLAPLCRIEGLEQEKLVLLPLTKEKTVIGLVICHLKVKLTKKVLELFSALTAEASFRLDKLSQGGEQSQAAPEGGQPEPSNPPVLTNPVRPRSSQTSPAGLTIAELQQALADVAVGGKVKISPYPVVATQLKKLIASENYTFAGLAKVIKTDQSLSADVLRYANSAYYRTQTKVTSLNQAIGRLGTKALTTIAITSGIAGHACAPGPLQEFKHLVWRQALCCGQICQQFAVHRRLDPEEAFVCGLLHDFGQIVAITVIEEILSKRKDAGAQPMSYWLELIDRFHVEFGRIVTTHWELPEMVLEVVTTHHHPEQAETYREMVDLVFTSDKIVNLLEINPLVTMEDLAEIPEMTDQREIRAIASFLPELPNFIIAPASRRRTARHKSMIAHEETTLQTEAHPVGFEVTHHRKEGDIKLTARYITDDGIGMYGPAQAQPNSLVSATLHHQEEPFKTWLKITLCKREKPGYFVEARPFAMTGDATEMWKDIIKDIDLEGSS